MIKTIAPFLFCGVIDFYSAKPIAHHKMSQKLQPTRRQHWHRTYQKLKQRLDRALQSGIYHTWTKHRQAQVQRRLTRYARRLATQTTLGTALLFGSSASIAADFCTDVHTETPPQISLSLATTNVEEDSGGALIYTFTRTTATTEELSEDLVVNFSISGTATIDDYNISGETTFDINTREGTITISAGNTSADLMVIPMSDTEVEEDESVIINILKARPFDTPQINPFGLTNVDRFSSPSFADIDNDGDLDVFVGNYDGNIIYFENNGSGSFSASQVNPFGLDDLGYISSPSFADIDNDGDLDAFIGNSDGNIIYFENNGSGSFSASQVNPFGLDDVNGSSTPSFADIDGDSDLDVFVGRGNFRGSNIIYFENNGSGSFTSSQVNPFGLVDIGLLPSPSFADIDGDNDLDAFIGTHNGNIIYFENNGSGSFLPPQTNPFGLLNIYTYGRDFNPSFADLDNDGDLDAFIGGRNGDIIYFENNGFSYEVNETVATQIGIIQNNDSKFTINALFSTKAEGNNGTTDFTFTVTRSGDLSQAAMVDYVVSGTTVNVADFGGVFPSGTLSFAANEDSQILTIQVIGDIEIENKETFRITLSNTTVGIIESAKASAKGSIQNDDLAQVSISISPSSVEEDNGNTLVYRFTRTGPTTTALLVNFNIGGTAENTDYVLNSAATFDASTGEGTVIIPIGSSSVDLIITPTNDIEVEDDESVIVNISSASSILSFDNSVFKPFGLSNVGSYASPSFADIDKDGDLDAFIGNGNGDIFYFENNNSSFAPAQINPIGLLNVGSYASLNFTDIDNDGDLDVFIGNAEGNLIYFENNDNGVFVNTQTNPFGLVDVGEYSKPSFADIDDDGDLDAFIGEYDGNIIYFENIGNASNPVFDISQTNPFGLASVFNKSNPSFTDIDGDGDLDAFIGNGNSDIFYFENNGSGIFTNTQTNPFGLTYFPPNTSPSFADIDGDGDLDLFVGEYGGNVGYFENIGNSNTPAFDVSLIRPFGLPSVSLYASPSFADLDGDGDLDALIGNVTRNTFYYENMGNLNSPIFEIDASQVNPFGLVELSNLSNPSFADIDGDGDLDVFIGINFGSITYFENIGDSNSPTFDTSQENPFGLMNIGSASTPNFVDIDDDGDLDAFIGEYDGNIIYFENVGDSNNPIFDTSQENPFGLIDIGFGSSPNFVDIDEDGDLDAFIGEYEGNVIYFENIGDANNPGFNVSQVNPFNLVDIGRNAKPNFADIDNDGDLDVFIGSRYGITFYFENTSGFHYEVDINASTQTGIIQNDDTPLAIEWFNFTGYLNKKQQTQLNWQILSTTGLKHFVIERSINGQAFEEIGSIAADDSNINEAIRYTYLDKDPQNGLNYYRIKSVELDGSSAYSTVVVVELANTLAATELLVYPNPNQGQARIVLPSHFEVEESLQLTILNHLGQVVQVAALTSTLEGKLDLNHQHLPTGVYFVQVQQGQHIAVARMMVE